MERTLKPWAGEPLLGKWNLLQRQINIFWISCIDVKTIIYAYRRHLAGQKGALQPVLCGQGQAGSVWSLCEPLPRPSLRSGTILAALGSSPVSENMEGEMGRGAQPWLGAEEQPRWTPSSVRDHLQLGWDFVVPGLLDCSLQPPPPAGCCYSGCFLHPSPAPSQLFSLFYFPLSDHGLTLPHPRA